MTQLRYESKKYYLVTKYGNKEGMSKYKRFLNSMKNPSKKVMKPKRPKTTTTTFGKTKRTFGFLFF